MKENGPPEGGKWPVDGIRPGVGLRPQMPLKCAGTRIDPPPSLPTPAADIPQAMPAASPPLDPPGVRSGSHGLASAIKKVVGLPGHEQFWSIGDAEHDRARTSQARDQRSVLLRNAAGAKPSAGFALEARDVDATLDADGHAVQRAQSRALHNCGFGLVGLPAHLRCVNMNERIQFGIQTFDLRQVRFSKIHGRNLFLADLARHFRRGEES